MIHAHELLLLILFLVGPPWLLGMVVLATLHVRAGRPGMGRALRAGALLLALSLLLALLLALLGPAGWGRWLGMRHEPVPWAPFAFLAVALAQPPAAWWLRR